MVDAIKSTVNRLELTKGRASDGRPATAGTSPAPVAPVGDSVKVSDAASSTAPSILMAASVAEATKAAARSHCWTESGPAARASLAATLLR